jgi:hypothetical protein
LTEISLLIPTRHRVPLVRRFLDSLAAATDRLDEIEVVLGVDDDDPESHTITHDKVALKIVIVPRGLTMGELGQKAFAVSTGRFVFAMNDDVIVETKGWDSRVREILQRFPDEIVIVHVNDDLFGKKLCCFPILSRRSCLEIGYFGSDYRRYKIDDHIYETYTLLAEFGYNRVVFLEEVLFRHDNFEDAHAVGVAETAFFAPGGKRYAPNMAVLAIDQVEYERQIDVRKRNARKLADLIERERYLQTCQKEQGTKSALSTPPITSAVWYDECVRHQARMRSHTNILAGVRDPYTHRNSHLSEHPPRRSIAMRSRLSIVLLADDIAAPSTKRSLASLKAHARGIELSVVSANGQPSFRRAQAAGRALATSDADFLLLVEAGIVIKPEWIDLLLETLNDHVAIVAPIYLDSHGTVASSGIHVDDDRPEWPRDHIDMPTCPSTRRAVRNGLLLIDLAKMGNPLVDPAYCLHFFDVDLCLRAWTSGLEVVCTPQVSVCLPEASESDPASARLLYDADAAVFLENWGVSGKVVALTQLAWSDHPTCMVTPPEPALQAVRLSVSSLWLGRLMDFIRTNPYALRRAMQVSTIRRRLMAWHERLPSHFKRYTQPLVDSMDKVYEKASAAQGTCKLGVYKSYKLMGFNGIICAIPPSLSDATLNATTLKDENVYVATSEEVIRTKIDQHFR